MLNILFPFRRETGESEWQLIDLTPLLQVRIQKPEKRGISCKIWCKASCLIPDIFCAVLFQAMAFLEWRTKFKGKEPSRSTELRVALVFGTMLSSMIPPLVYSAVFLKGFAHLTYTFLTVCYVRQGVAHPFFPSGKKNTPYFLEDDQANENV